MNALVQQEDGLIGSAEDIKALQEKEEARLLVVSDTHGESELLEQILEKFGSECDALVFCGDGACDVEFCIERAFFDEDFRNCLPPVIAFARGNGDAPDYVLMIDPEDFEVPPAMRGIAVPDWICFEAAGRTVYAVHGHRHNVDWGTDTLQGTAYTMDADMVFFGHTHRPFAEEIEGTLFLNPGSVARPRGGSSHSFAVVSFPGTAERFEIQKFSVQRSIFNTLSFHEI